jgi:hypothetical protein
MKTYLKCLIFAAAAVLVLASSYNAQSCSQEAEAPVYQKFLANFKGTPEQQKTAYDAAKEYLDRFGQCPSDPEKKVADYVRMWSQKWELAAAKFDCINALNDAPNQAFAVCQTYAAKDPESLTAYLLLSRASITVDYRSDPALKDRKISAIKRTLALIDSGKTADTWYIAPNQAEAKRTLEFYAAYMTKEETPAETASVMRRLAESSLSLSKDPGTYYALGFSLYRSAYKKSYEDYTALCSAKNSTPECDAAYKKTVDNLDRVMNAFARAIAFAKDDQRSARFAAQSRTNLTELYKQTHNGSDEGLDQFIASVLSRPLP